MASKKSTTIVSIKKAQTKKVIQTNSLNNLEAFACLWLDADVANTEDNRETEQNLRQFINHLRTFNKANECVEVIEKTKKEKVVLIVSGKLGRDVIPSIHHLPQLIACYIYCFDESEHQEWAKNYPNVIILKFYPLNLVFSRFKVYILIKQYLLQNLIKIKKLELKQKN
jgi:hypothetical protein